MSGVAAVVSGTIDWMEVSAGTRAKRVGFVHGTGNIVVLFLFAMSWVIRRDDPPPPDGLATGIAVVGAALSGLTEWLGGELVVRS